MSRGSKGFTLVEGLVATVLAAVGVAGAVGALGSLTRAQAALQDRERMQLLAVRKYSEIVGQGIANTATEGDFQDWNEDRYKWQAVIAPTGIEGLDSLRVTVQHAEAVGREVGVQGVVFTPPAGGAQ